MAGTTDDSFVTPPLSPLAKGTALLQLAFLLGLAPLYGVYGVSVDLASNATSYPMFALLAGLWVFYRYFRGGRDAFLLSEVICACLLVSLISNITAPAQYLAVAMNQPLIDPYLAAADGWLGIHVADLTAWTAQYPMLLETLITCYFLLLPQFFLPILLLGLWFRDLERVWEYVFLFHFCTAVTIVSLAVFPAECAFTYYGFESTINQERFIRHFAGFRDGTMTVVRFDDLEGLISMPSFHVAGALIVTYGFRGYRYLWPPLALLNTFLIAATVMTGAHYFIDLVATTGMFVLAVLAWKYWGKRAMRLAPSE